MAVAPWNSVIKLTLCTLRILSCGYDAWFCKKDQQVIYSWTQTSSESQTLHRSHLFESLKISPEKYYCRLCVLGELWRKQSKVLQRFSRSCYHWHWCLQSQWLLQLIRPNSMRSNTTLLEAHFNGHLWSPKNHWAKTDSLLARTRSMPLNVC